MIPNLDNLECCFDYLRDLGAKHQQHGVRREHLDLMALVYCSAIRGVVATQGKFSSFPQIEHGFPTLSISALARERERVAQPQLFSPSCLSRPIGRWPVQAAWRE